MHPPDQAKHNKPSLDEHERLEVIFYDVLCIAQKKIAVSGSVTTSFRWGCRNGSRSGKSRFSLTGPFGLLVCLVASEDCSALLVLAADPAQLPTVV